MDNRIWVSWKESVYDVTDFIKQGHPGGPVAIRQAAGGPLEPFWEFYKLHRHPNVQAVLAKYKIGTLHPDDRISLDPDEEGDDDIVQPDLDRHPDLYKYSVQDFPFNAMTPPDIIIRNFLTPYHAGYIRSHNRVPVIDESKHKVDFFIGDKYYKSITMKELKSLPTHSVMNCMRCAGHRRSEMLMFNPRIVGVNYGPFAISNVVYTGPRVTDVYKYLGINIDDYKGKGLHQVCTGADIDFPGDPVEVSIPLDHAFDHRNECIFAYLGNGEPLPPDHGYPLRFLVPGFVGIRNCKWLFKVQISDREGQGRFQQRAYKVFKEKEWKDVDLSKYPAPLGHCLNSVICYPRQEQEIVVPKNDPRVTIKGIAAGEGGTGAAVTKVEVSFDGGREWREAKITQRENKDWTKEKVFSWVHWEYDYKIDRTHKHDHHRIKVICRAFDSQGHEQNKTVEELMNLSGTMVNHPHSVVFRYRLV